MRHPGQSAVAAVSHAAGQLAAAGDQERHIKLAAGDRHRHLDLFQALLRVHAAAPSASRAPLRRMIASISRASVLAALPTRRPGLERAAHRRPERHQARDPSGASNAAPSARPPPAEAPTSPARPACSWSRTASKSSA